MNKNQFTFKSHRIFQKITYCGKLGPVEAQLFPGPHSPCLKLRLHLLATESSCLTGAPQSSSSDQVYHTKTRRELKKENQFGYNSPYDTRSTEFIKPATTRNSEKAMMDGKSHQYIHTLNRGTRVMGWQTKKTLVPPPWDNSAQLTRDCHWKALS